jgi:hypothetical protein
MATNNDTGDYATWVKASVLRHAETKDPPRWLAGLEEEEAVVPAEHHSAEWPPLAADHVGNHDLRG